MELKIKRTMGNSKVTHGIFYAPDYDFKCHVMELREVPDTAKAKINCAVPLGRYALTRSFGCGSLFWPVFQRQLRGFAQKPRFDTENLSYSTLGCGNIAVGLPNDDVSLKADEQLKADFASLWRDIFLTEDYVVIDIYKTNRFRFVDFEIGDDVVGRTNWVEDNDDDE